MTTINWSRLQNGTDIRGTALADAGNRIELTEEVVTKIGDAFITWLSGITDKNSSQLSIAIGVDSRLTADRLKQYLSQAFTARGVYVYDCGLASTPAMFMSTILESHQYDGAIMITASHLPYDKNGLKFFTNKGGLEKEDITELIRIAKNKEFNPESSDRGEIKEVNLIDDYAGHIKNLIRENAVNIADRDKPLKGFKIVVDAGNGSGGFFADKILEPLGASTGGSQYLDPDGHFPHHTPNPEDNQAMESIKKAVLDNKADLGIIFDTDVDRAAVVDENGQAINRNKLIALAASIVLEDYPGSYIVTDSVTSRGLKSFIEEKLGGHHHRFKRGYKNVINEAKRLENEGKEAPLAIETSGHAAFKENYFLDDGAYLVAKILIKMANLKATNQGKIGDLIADLEEANIKEEYRMPIQLEDFHEYGEQVLEKLKTHINQRQDWDIAPENYEGVRVNCGGNDWFLMRMSLHDPVLVLNIECDTKKTLNFIKKELLEFLSAYKKVDVNPLS